MHRTNPAILQTVLAQLEQATLDHATWRDHVLQVLTGRHPADPGDLAPGAHRRCRFGEWYFRHALPELRELPSFTMLGAEHESQHELSTKLMAALAAGGPLTRKDIEEFEEACARVSFGLHFIRREIECTMRSRDALTDAHSSGEMLRDLRDWRALGRQPGRECCIAIMEPDGVQEINARHGYQVGAKALVTAVRIVSENLRAADKVFRHDGNKFLIRLARTNLASGKMVIERLREVLNRRLTLVGADGESVEVTVSFGVALLDPEVDALESIDRADQALTLARTAGRNKIIRWDPSVTTGVRLRRLEVKNAEET